MICKELVTLHRVSLLTNHHLFSLTNFINMQQFLSKAIMGLVLLAAVLAACTQADPAAAKKSAAAPMAAVSTAATDSLTTAQAKNEKAAWDSVRTVIMAQLRQANSPNGKYIMQGFQIPVDDLKNILAAYNSNPQPSTDTIYGMLSINGAGQPGLILQTKNSQNNSVYYDFSRPCPPNCPKNF